MTFEELRDKIICSPDGRVSSQFIDDGINSKDSLPEAEGCITAPFDADLTMEKAADLWSKRLGEHDDMPDPPKYALDAGRIAAAEATLVLIERREDLERNFGASGSHFPNISFGD